MPQVSSAIDKFLREQALSSAEQSSLRSQIGIPSLQSAIQSNSMIPRPVCSFFEDFLGVSNGGAIGGNGGFSWSVSGNTGASAIADAMPLAYGVIQLATGATTNNARSITLQAGGNTMVGAKNRFCFAIPSFTDCAVWFGGGGNWHLYASSATNSGQWVVRTNNGTITTFTAATPQVGDFASGKRYQCEVCLVSTTVVAIKLEIADFNASNWTTVFDGNVTVPAVNSEWSGSSAWAGVVTLANVAKTLRIDWISQEHTGINR